MPGPRFGERAQLTGLENKSKETRKDVPDQAKMLRAQDRRRRLHDRKSESRMEVRSLGEGTEFMLKVSPWKAVRTVREVRGQAEHEIMSDFQSIRKVGKVWPNRLEHPSEWSRIRRKFMLTIAPVVWEEPVLNSWKEEIKRLKAKPDTMGLGSLVWNSRRRP
ncbi:hypothetical protein Tco_0539937 [Tanacetum coccineum]